VIFLAVVFLFVYIEGKMAKPPICCWWNFEKIENNVLHDAFSQCFKCLFTVR